MSFPEASGVEPLSETHFGVYFNGHRTLFFCTYMSIHWVSQTMLYLTFGARSRFGGNCPLPQRRNVSEGQFPWKLPTRRSGPFVYLFSPERNSRRSKQKSPNVTSRDIWPQIAVQYLGDRKRWDGSNRRLEAHMAPFMTRYWLAFCFNLFASRLGYYSTARRVWLA